MKKENNNQLTDEQIEFIADEMGKAIKDTPLEDLANMPSNQGKIERSKDEVTETGENKKMSVKVDPNTGEHSIIGSAEEDDNDESFEDMAKRIENDEIVFDQTPITEKEMIEYISNSKSVEHNFLSEISEETDLQPESVKKLLDIVNRRLNKEEFNVYKEFPEEIQNMVNRYIINGGIPLFSKEGKQFRNMLSEQLISEFITNINMDRIKNDFSKEIEDLFEKGSNELADSIIGYTSERNQAYREHAEKMEDIEKREKVLNILDQIDAAYSLNDLKEFSKKCKIKSIELEKPVNKVYSSFLSKYKDSPYNIYDINMARPILFRNLNDSIDEEFRDKDIDAFLICFCKQCDNMTPNNVIDHAYMYYVIYNIVLTDLNKGESVQISKDFLKNVKEVIYNLRKRNNNFA